MIKRISEGVIYLYSHIKDNIFSIYVRLPNNPLKNINSYLIKGEDRNLLIDTGFRQEECLEDILKGLSELGVSMENTDIFLTHAHFDHSGLAHELAGSNSKIFMSEKDAEIFIRSLGDENIEFYKDRQRVAGFPEETVRPYKMLVSAAPQDVNSDNFIQIIDDGTVLSYGGRKLLAVLTPGHTPGHMCLYDAKNKIMFLGDHVLFDITPNIVRWPDVEDSLGAYIKSLLDISGYEIEIPLPAHRGVAGSVSDRVGSIIEHHGRRVKELADILDMHPDSTAYFIAGKMSWDIKYNGDWDCFPEEQKFYAVLEVCAHLDYLVARGRAEKTVRGIVEYYSPIKNRHALY